MGKFSKSILAIVLVGFLTLPCDSRVGAVTFTFNGFQEKSLHSVSNSSWISNSTTGCFKFDPTAITNKRASVAGRLLYPSAVQMRDPGSTTVKSFSATFIYQFHIVSEYGYHSGPGLAFSVVPDDITLGAPGDHMGLITKETTETAKNYESDNHTLGVELDIFMNREFNDINSNHIGINLASMNSTYSLKPVYSLASSNVSLQQIWIDYHEADSRMDIYYANYKEGKPATPQGSRTGLDLSLLKEKMYIGFSSANKIGSGAVPHVCAWSFSNNDIPAPPIVLAQDATPDVPVAAPSLPPPASTPSAAPSISSPPPPPFGNTGPPQAPPLPSPSQIFLSPNGSASPLHGPPSINLAAVVGATVGGAFLIVGLCLLSLCWCKVFQRPFRIFLSHSGGLNGEGKHFPSWLYQEISRRRWSRLKFRVKPFLDVENCPKGLPFAGEISKELERFDVGIVVVTPDFFSKHWPMTELVKFVEVQKKDRQRRIRLLPLFFKLTPGDLKKSLDKGEWEYFWDEPKGDHSLKLQECKDAVMWLCQQTGIPCLPGMLEREYIVKIMEEVDKILCRERSFAAHLRWVGSLFKRNKT